MVYLPSSHSAKLVDQLALMASSANSVDSFLKTRMSRAGYLSQRNRRLLNSAASRSNSPSSCRRHGSRSAAVDVVILIAVVGACGFLLFPYAKFIAVQLIENVGPVTSVIKEEFSEAPLIYGSIGLSVCFAACAMLALVACLDRKCGNPNCRGLRKAAEFDIQLETEECVKNSTVKEDSERLLFELPTNQHRELEAELKKMAPPNGRAVLVFRARCGCSVGRLEVPGPKKQPRKIKK